MMLRGNLKKVSKIWKKEGIKLEKPLAVKDLFDVFADLKVSISYDVIDVYSK